MPILAVKGVQTVYQDPFDIAGGGAALTRASQDAVVFANPALMPWGDKIFRYAGVMPIVRYTPQSVEFGQALSSAEQSEYVDLLFAGDDHVHGGVGNVMSVITSHFGFVGFMSTVFDLEANEHGSVTGGPSIDFMNETYGGVALGFAGRANSWFSYGVTPKYIIKTEPDLAIAIADQAGIESLSDSDALTERYQPGSGLGFDVGALLFAQGTGLDYRLALKVDDLGDTQFSGQQESFKQVVSVGQALTLHGHVHALHLALDYRDILDAYEQKMFKKVYAGAKLMLQNHLGFAIGLYHGLPSYGVRLDLWVLKFGVTQYSEELSSVIGKKRRTISIFYLSMGW